MFARPLCSDDVVTRAPSTAVASQTSGRLRTTVHRIANGGLGTAGAVLLPRVWSVLTQWTVAAAAGTAALTDYLTTTTRGSAAVSLIANALAPVLILRRGAMRTSAGRALVGASLVLISAAAFALTFIFEAVLGLGTERGVFTAAFAAVTVLGAPAVAMWPVWQARGRYLPLLALMTVVLLAGFACAVLGNARLAAVTIALASSVPTLAMLGRARLRRAAMYGLSIARRALPVSSMSFATALVYPLSLQLGTSEFGATIVGQQLLFWPLVMALGIASQSIAARMISGTGSEPDRLKALTKWTAISSALLLLATGAFAVFRWRLTPSDGVSPLPLGMVVAAGAFIFSDPLCVYFCPPSGWRVVALGSVASALLVGTAVLLWPHFIIDHVSVVGPSAMVAALRLAFIRQPGLRGRARAVLTILALGFAVAAWLR